MIAQQGIEGALNTVLVKTGGPLMMLVWVLWRYLKLDHTRGEIEGALREEIERLKEMRIEDREECRREMEDMRRLHQEQLDAAELRHRNDMEELRREFLHAQPRQDS